MRAHTVAAFVAVLAVAGLFLPWWTAGHTTYLVTWESVTDEGAETLRGIDVVGSWAIVLVVGAAVVAVVAAVLESSARWWWIGAAGIAQATVALVIVASWGIDFGSAGTLAAGLVVAVIALRALVTELSGRLKALPAVLLLVAVPAAFVPADKLGDTADRDPFVHVAAGDNDLVPLDDGVGLATDDGVSTLGDVRPALLARVERPGIPLGVADGRLVVFWPFIGPDDTGELRIGKLGAREQAVVTGVDSVNELSPQGTVLVRTGDEAELEHRLDVTRLAAGTTTSADKLAAVSLPDSPGFSTVRDEAAWFWIVDHPGAGQLATVDDGPEGEHLEIAEPGKGTRIAAGGYDPDCGLTNSGPDSYLRGIGAVTADRADGWWFTADSRLLHLAADGTLRATAPLPIGAPTTLLATGNDVHLGTENGVWRLPDAESRLGTLPAPSQDCHAHPEVAKPAQLTPLALPPGTSNLLDVSGRRAALGTGDVIEVVAADGTRTQAGPRQGEEDGLLEFVPDGAGGMWWLETVVPVAGQPLARQLVHASAGGVVTRQPPAGGGGERNRLSADLSGGVPLVGWCPPMRFSNGAARTIPAIEELKGESGCLSPVVGRDGRGWVAADRGLYSFDPASVGPATRVVGGDDDVPVAVALARGAEPSAVSLRDATTAFDSTGRVLVLSEDVLLGVAAAGPVTVVAQDERLRGGRLTAVEGGAVVTLRDGTVHRLGY